MRHFTFNDDTIAAIRRERFHHPHPRVQQKMEVLWLKSQGLTHDDIARLADVSRRSVQRYLDEFLEGGLDRVRRLAWKGAPNALAPHQGCLEDYFLHNPPRSAREAQLAIERQTGVRRGLTRVRAFFQKSLGLRRRKTGTVPAKADPANQGEFLKSKLRPRLRQAERGHRAVPFADAAHFVYGPFLGYLWCLTRQFVPGRCGRKRYNVLAALNAVTHQVTRVTNHAYINADSVCQLLVKVASARLPGPVTLVMDIARYQRCEKVTSLARCLRVELLFLPSYSPNLNPIERLWRFVKEDCLGSKPIGSYEEFTGAIDDCLSRLTTTHKDRMKSLLTLNSQTFDDVPVIST